MSVTNIADPAQLTRDADLALERIAAARAEIGARHLRPGACRRPNPRDLARRWTRIVDRRAGTGQD